MMRDLAEGPVVLTSRSKGILRENVEDSMATVSDRRLADDTDPTL